MALIQSDWCLYKKRRSGRRHTQRRDRVNKHVESSRLQAKEEGLGGNEQECRHFDPGLPAPRTVRKSISVV